MIMCNIRYTKTILPRGDATLRWRTCWLYSSHGYYLLHFPSVSTHSHITKKHQQHSSQSCNQLSKSWRRTTQSLPLRNHNQIHTKTKLGPQKHLEIPPPLPHKTTTNQTHKGKYKIGLPIYFKKQNPQNTKLPPPTPTKNLYKTYLQRQLLLAIANNTYNKKKR